MTATSPTYQGDRTREAGRTNGHRAVRTFTETKAFYKTSEFLVWLFAAAAVLVVTYAAEGRDSLSTWHGWLFVTILSAAYMFSRGIAKSGSREPYTREDDR